METSSLPMIEILLLILGIPALLVLMAYGAVLLLRQQSRAIIRNIGAQIQKHSDRLAQIAQLLQEYADIDQEPYSASLDELQKEAVALQVEMQRFLEESRNFEAEMNTPGTKGFREIINAPYDEFMRWRRAGELQQASQAIASRLSGAEERAARIHDLPWELAQQSRQVHQEIAEIVETARGLQAKGARGAPLQAVLNLIPQFGRSLDEIPEAFLQADQQSLIAATDLDVAIRVFEALNQLKPAVSRYLPQVREWKAAYQKASAEFAELKQAGTALRQAMAKPPEGLAIAGLQGRLDQTAQMAAELGQRLAVPDVGELKSLAREMGLLRKVIQDTGRQLAHASQQASELAKAQSDLQDSLGKLSGQYTDLETRAAYPLVLDVSREEHNDLDRQLQALGPVQQPRTPAQITQQLKVIETLRKAHQAHVEAFPKVARQYAGLVALLESSELKDSALWLRKARELADQVADYDPRNWTKQDSVRTLAEDLDEFSLSFHSLIPINVTAQIKESELEQRLRDTQHVMVQYKALQSRVESVRVRLDKIQAGEKEAKDRLAGAYTALERVALLAESNDLLDELAMAEIDQLNEEIRQLGNELNERGRGEVDKKLQKIQAESEKVNQALNGWLAQLNAAIAGLGKDIEDRLTQLAAIARLDEPVVDDARNVLAREEYRSALQGRTGAASPGGLRSMAARVVPRPAELDDLAVGAAIKRQNDLWQTLRAVQKGLEERTGALVMAYQEALQARDEARNGLAEVKERLSDRRSWPPTNQSPLTEAQLLRPIDEKWEALKKQPWRIEPAILELGRLTQQYKLASERARHLISQAERDAERVQALEDQIQGLKQRWQDQLQTVPASVMAHASVQQLMSQTDSKLAYIRQQYLRGALSYDQSLHNLQLLCDELLTTRVPVDDQSDIGLNEAYHAQSS